jgi:hypothetical protein
MNWKEHIRIAKFVKDNLPLKFSPELEKRIQWGSIKPDKLRKVNPELHKGGETALKAIFKARQEYLTGSLEESLEWLGVALHNIADEINYIVLDSRINWQEWIENKEWEQGISRSPLPEGCNLKLNRLGQIKDYIYCTWSHSDQFTQEDMERLKPLIEWHPLNQSMEYSVSLELEGETRPLFRIKREPATAFSYIAQVCYVIAEVIYRPSDEYTLQELELALFPTRRS